MNYSMPGRISRSSRRRVGWWKFSGRVWKVTSIHPFTILVKPTQEHAMSSASTGSNNPDRLGQVENAIKTFSRPSELKITDLRLAVVASNYDYPILRIDTNQGVYGLSEVRDAGHSENALQFKRMR